MTMPQQAGDFAAWLNRTAGSLDVAAIACLRPNDIDPNTVADSFGEWTRTDDNAELLGYVAATVDQRTDPFAARPWASAAIVVGFPGHWDTPTARLDLPEPAPGAFAGLVSAYACGRDYHRIGRELLDGLATELNDRLHTSFRHESCVDTQPVPEVCLAVTGGLGCLGLNGLLRTPQTGSRVFVGVLFVSVSLPSVRADSSEPEPACAECGACVRECPTKALAEGRPLRVGRCRSYLSIEAKGPLSTEQQQLLGDVLFGCDACTACCPPAATVRPGQRIDLEWLLKTSAAELRRRIADTALEHAGVTRLKRNAVAVLRNDSRPEARALVRWVAANSGSEVVRLTASAD